MGWDLGLPSLCKGRNWDDANTVALLAIGRNLEKWAEGGSAVHALEGSPTEGNLFLKRIWESASPRECLAAKLSWNRAGEGWWVVWPCADGPLSCSSPGILCLWGRAQGCQLAQTSQYLGYFHKSPTFWIRVILLETQLPVKNKKIHF